MRQLVITLALVLAAGAQSKPETPSKPAEAKPLSTEQRLEISRANSQLLAAQRDYSVAAQQFQAARERHDQAQKTLAGIIAKHRAALNVPEACVPDENQNWVIPSQRPDGQTINGPCVIEPQTKEEKKK
jgi:hypothetical protein